MRTNVAGTEVMSTLQCC